MTLVIKVVDFYLYIYENVPFSEKLTTKYFCKRQDLHYFYSTTNSIYTSSQNVRSSWIIKTHSQEETGSFSPFFGPQAAVVVCMKINGPSKYLFYVFIKLILFYVYTDKIIILILLSYKVLLSQPA